MMIDKSITRPYDSNLTYQKGNVIMHNNIMYQCTDSIDTPEEFDSSKWKRAYLMDILNKVNSQMEIIALVAFGNGSWEFTEYPSEHFSISTNTNQTVTLTCNRAVTGKLIAMCRNRSTAGYTFTLKHNTTVLSSAVANDIAKTYQFSSNGYPITFTAGDTLTITSSTADNRNDFHIFIYNETTKLSDGGTDTNYSACLNTWGGSLHGVAVNNNLISDYTGDNSFVQFTVNCTGTLKVILNLNLYSTTTGAGTVYLNETAIQTFTNLGEKTTPATANSNKEFYINVTKGDVIKFLFTSANTNADNKIYLLSM